LIINYIWKWRKKTKKKFRIDLEVWNVCAYLCTRFRKSNGRQQRGSLQKQDMLDVTKW